MMYLFETEEGCQEEEETHTNTHTHGFKPWVGKVNPPDADVLQFPSSLDRRLIGEELWDL